MDLAGLGLAGLKVFSMVQRPRSFLLSAWAQGWLVQGELVLSGTENPGEHGFWVDWFVHDKCALGCASLQLAFLKILNTYLCLCLRVYA